MVQDTAGQVVPGHSGIHNSLGARGYVHMGVLCQHGIDVKAFIMF